MRDEGDEWGRREGGWVEDAFKKGKLTRHFGGKCGCGLVLGDSGIRGLVLEESH